MKINENDLETINILKKKHKFLKSLSVEEIVDLYLSRCEHCNSLCFGVDLIPLMNYKGKVGKLCPSCHSELLTEMHKCSQEDYELQYIEDSYYEKL